MTKTEINNFETENNLRLMFFDDCINEVPFELATNLTICSWADGYHNSLSVNKLPKNKSLITSDWLLAKWFKKLNYQYVDYSKIFKNIGLNNIHCYVTTYGFGVEVIFGDKPETCNKITEYLNSKNIEFTTEYSDAHWVYRFKISKSIKNLDLIKSL